MVKLSKRDLQIIVGIAGVADFLAEGRFSAPVARAMKKAAVAAASKALLNPGQIPTNRALAGAIGRGVVQQVPRMAGTVARVGGTIAMRHPYIAAGAVIYVAAKNRDQIADLIREGYDVVQPTVSEGLQTLADLDAPIVGTRRPAFTKKTQSKFNKAVSKGMKIVKASTSYGKKGTINNAKKAFSAVTKVASAASKKKKAPKKGITRKIYLGVKGLFK